MFITTNCLPISPGKTGIGAYAANLVESLSRYPGGHRYALICGQDETLLPDLDAEAFSLVPVEVRDWTWCQLQLPALLEETAADVFLSPFFTSPVVKSCPSVVTLHDMIPLAEPELTPPDFREYFEATIDQSLALADRVITVSEHARSDIVRFRPEAEPKVRVVHQAVSARFRPVEEAELAGVRKELELETPYILYVGSIEERKNIGGLLEAFGQLPQRDDLQLVLCGRENTDGYDLEGRIRAAGLEGKVVHLGYVKDEQLPALYSGCSAFVFPSFYEGFGLPALEAMACGRPSISLLIVRQCSPFFSEKV